MTRRAFLLAAAAIPTPLRLPIRLLFDSRSRPSPAQLDAFHKTLWPETVRGFARAGVTLDVTTAPGEIRRLPSDKPLLTNLDRHALNVIVTAAIPLYWDNGRGLAGLTLLYEGCHVSLISLQNAHPHRVPLLSTNTVLHELLHAILEDVYLARPGRLEAARREWRVDLAATRLWLFPHNPAIAEYVRRFLPRLGSR